PRGAVDPVHHARPESSPLHFRRLPRSHLQTLPRRKSSRHAGQSRQAARRVRLDPFHRLPLGKRTLRRRNPQLAGTETGPRTHSLRNLVGVQAALTPSFLGCSVRFITLPKVSAWKSVV